MTYTPDLMLGFVAIAGAAAYVVRAAVRKHRQRREIREALHDLNVSSEALLRNFGVSTEGLSPPNAEPDDPNAPAARFFAYLAAVRKAREEDDD